MELMIPRKEVEQYRDLIEKALKAVPDGRSFSQLFDHPKMGT